MGILTFIVWIFALVVAGVISLCIAVVVNNTRDIEIENERLKEEIKKLKARYLKREYKKAKEVKK